jgi:hypothetical protein
MDSIVTVVAKSMVAVVALIQTLTPCILNLFLCCHLLSWFQKVRVFLALLPLGQTDLSNQTLSFTIQTPLSLWWKPLRFCIVSMQKAYRDVKDYFLPGDLPPHVDLVLKNYHAARLEGDNPKKMMLGGIEINESLLSKNLSVLKGVKKLDADFLAGIRQRMLVILKALYL